MIQQKSFVMFKAQLNGAPDNNSNNIARPSIDNIDNLISSRESRGGFKFMSCHGIDQ